MDPGGMMPMAWLIEIADSQAIIVARSSPVLPVHKAPNGGAVISRKPVPQPPPAPRTLPLRASEAAGPGTAPRDPAMPVIVPVAPVNAVGETLVAEVARPLTSKMIWGMFKPLP